MSRCGAVAGGEVCLRLGAGGQESERRASQAREQVSTRGSDRERRLHNWLAVCARRRQASVLETLLFLSLTSHAMINVQ